MVIVCLSFPPSGPAKKEVTLLVYIWRQANRWYNKSDIVDFFVEFILSDNVAGRRRGNKNVLFAALHRGRGFNHRMYTVRQENRCQRY